MRDRAYKKTQRWSSLLGVLVYNGLLVFLSRGLFLLCFAFLPSFGLDFPLELHGDAHIGRYLNSDTNRYYIEVSTDFYCTLIRHNKLTFFIRYRDELDVAGYPQAGVIFDPIEVHYYLILGTEYLFSQYFISGFFVHDCVHRLDLNYYVHGNPIFNRFKLSFGDKGVHYAQRLKRARKFLWQFTLGWYPQWQYNNWHINYGADYRFDILSDLKYIFFKKGALLFELNTIWYLAKAETSYYQQHLAQFSCHYQKDFKSAIGLRLGYNIFNNDPIKSPNRLWLLSISFVF